ncbi:intron-encoded homing endonuclease [Anaeramoeba ignava]|uniref:Intron-encoded homing endonuclease n=1 Tax=Anaeramoeba ignava TaxID=1746090 RepID=A0A9Q0LVQ9_ANAIG|nr:intron-encoded homing endonuclease [Anaeramoeba ignava]
MTHNNLANHDESFKFLPYQFRKVVSLRNGYYIQGRQQARKLPNRASLVPAAAVIPALIVYTKVVASEVKFNDLLKINRSESVHQVCSHQSRTKVRGSKTIRYRRKNFQNLVRNHKYMGSGGSMDASLKLKGIDGRAPPGVELVA